MVVAGRAVKHYLVAGIADGSWINSHLGESAITFLPTIPAGFLSYA